MEILEMLSNVGVATVVAALGILYGRAEYKRAAAERNNASLVDKLAKTVAARLDDRGLIADLRKELHEAKTKSIKSASPDDLAAGFNELFSSESD